MSNNFEHGFKLNDEVRVLVKAAFGDLEVGTVGVITHVKFNGAVCVGDSHYGYFYGSAGGQLELVTTKYPNPPHKHAELITAWADGADIEYQVPNSAKPGCKWINTPMPLWVIDTVYRIKPAKPVKSDKDIQIEKLEQQAIDLAAAISKLKDGA